MNDENEMCCLCLSESNKPFVSLFLKNEDDLTNFDKISSSLSQLANVLYENADCDDYKLCNKCCDTIKLVYSFNRSCLHNARIYLSQKKSKNPENQNEQSNLTGQLRNYRRGIIDDKSKNANNQQHITPFYHDICEVVLDEGSKKEEASKDSSSESDTEKKKRDKKKVIKSSEVVKTAGNQIEAQKEYTCSKCSQKFQHDLTIISETGEKLYLCETCNRPFKRRYDLELHKLIHSGEKPQLCITCGKQFRDRSALAKHKRTHSGIKPYVCDHCGKSFTQKIILTNHIRVHTKERPFTCNVCGNCFTLKSSLSKHMAKQHS